jgi:predicted transcriptional regulator
LKIESHKEVGDLLKEKRTKANVDAANAASMAGVGRRLLLELEAGKRPNVSFTTVLRLLHLFGLELHVVPRGLPGTSVESRATVATNG